MTHLVRLDLVRLIQQAVPQVFGADERSLLYDWLARNTDEQLVEIDLDEVRPTTSRAVTRPVKHGQARSSV